MTEQTEALLRAAFVGFLKEMGGELRNWVRALDDIAGGVVDTDAECMHPHARVLRDVTRELALSCAQAYAKAFNSLVEYGIAAGLSSVAAELQAVAKYKDLIRDPHTLFNAMCEEYRAQRKAAH